MKKAIALFFICFCALRIFSQEIPAVKITDVIKMIDTSNSPLVINFWATWCVPCIEEIPWFENQVSFYKEKGVKLILVSLDFKEDYPAGIKSFIQKKKYTSEVMWLNETDANYFCSMIDKAWQGSIPASLFVDKTKNYRHFV